MSCAARYQETPSFEFILNPFKFFFTNYVKKTRQTEYGQASLVDAVSVTYNLGPLATIEARIKAALLPVAPAKMLPAGAQTAVENAVQTAGSTA
jgi:hypothetical protein